MTFVRVDVLQGIMARVYETSVVLVLLAILVTSIVWVGLALIDRGRTTDEGRLKMTVCFAGVHTILELNLFLVKVIGI